MSHYPNKKLLHQALGLALEEKLSTLEEESQELMNAKEADIKSSAGDKYETGRETLGQAQQLLETQKSKLMSMRQQLQHIPLGSTDSLGEGALLELSMGWVWVAIPFGKLLVEGWEVQVVSQEAPLVQALKKITRGGEVTLGGRSIRWMEVY